MVRKGAVVCLVTLLSLTVAVCFCKGEKEEGEKKPAEKLQPPISEDYVRPSMLAGSWFPDDAGELRNMINDFLDKAEKKELSGKLIGIICPHAGYIFSGPVAAYSYKQLIGRKYDTVVMLGVCHRAGGIAGFVSVFPGGWYETPLGRVKVNSEIAMKILNAGEPIQFVKAAHLGEHSLEIQLPFLQTVLEDFQIVPILISGCSMKQYEFVSKTIAEAVKGRNVLLLASSDLSHYPRYEDACRVDRAIMQAWTTMDPMKIMQEQVRLMREDVPNLACVMCGDDAVITTIMTAKLLGADEVVLLKYANSGDTAGDKSRVVGYGAAALVATGKKSAKQDPPRENPSEAKKPLQPWEKRLLKIAREAIEASVKGERVPDYPVDDPELQKHQGAFVTIKNPKKAEPLRGCIGRFMADEPLYKVVREMAVAATRDPRFRFDRITRDELKEIEIEISVLSPLKLIDDPMKIELGKHGIYIVNRRLGRSGCFLPQVATETGWTKEQFLSYCCAHKAGLPPDSWKNDPNTKVYVFTAHIIKEK